MNFPKSLIKKGLLFFIFMHLAQFCFSQEADSTKRVINFKGAVSITNNGFSLVPTFSLGKPAVVTIFSVSGKGRLSFEPEIRYSMEFKPWSMVFIWRYKLVRKEKFQLALGTHLPALNFITGPVIKNGVQRDAIQARRFFPVMELIPNYMINKNINLGIYYLYSIGLEKELTKDNHFASLRVGFNDIPFIKRCYLRFNPQFYYLKLDERDGFYIAGSLTLAHRDCPFSLSTLMNKAIDSNILAKDFDWNISLNYAFGRDYVRK